MVAGLLNAQTYPFSEDFDATTVGMLPSGWTSTGGFMVYGSPHGWSAPNACSVQMNAGNTQDTLVTPTIGPITANTKLSLAYRFVDAALYPNTGTQLQSGDQITIDVYLAGSWNNAVATIDMTTHPTPLTTFTTYTYNCTLCAFVAGQNAQMRLDAARANGDWFLDIDNVIVGDNITGISYVAGKAPSLVVAPNPSHDNFWIWMRDYSGSEPVTVKLYNHVGQLVKTVTPEVQYVNQVNVSTENLARGVYMVEVSSKHGISTTKIVIE